MPLIDHTYFSGELNLPNTGSLNVQQRLNHFIAKYEEKFLIEAMGYELYTSFIAGLGEATINQVWLDILYGRDYVSNGRLTKWGGLIELTEVTATIVPNPLSITLTSTGGVPQSMIANYVYYHWMRNEATQTSAVGETATNTENSTRTSPSNKMCRAWNEMVDKVWQLVRFIDANVIVYPEWQGVYLGTTNYRYTNSFSSVRLSDIFYHINGFNL